MVIVRRLSYIWDSSGWVTYAFFMQSRAKLSVESKNAAAVDCFPARDRQLASIQTLPPARLREEIASKLNSEQSSLLFQNMPLGIMGESYTEFMENDAIKEKLLGIGIDCVRGYGIEMPLPFVEILNSAGAPRE